MAEMSFLPSVLGAERHHNSKIVWIPYQSPIGRKRNTGGRTLRDNDRSLDERFVNVGHVGVSMVRKIHRIAHKLRRIVPVEH